MVLTSNASRELSDALKRRCLHLYIDFPTRERELAIVRARVPEAAEALARSVVAAVAKLRTLDLKKPPSISETLDWVRALAVLNAERLDPALLDETLNLVLKYEADVARAGAAERGPRGGRRGSVVVRRVQPRPRPAGGPAAQPGRHLHNLLAGQDERGEPAAVDAARCRCRGRRTSGAGSSRFGTSRLLREVPVDDAAPGPRPRERPSAARRARPRRLAPARRVARPRPRSGAGWSSRTAGAVSRRRGTNPA